MLTYIKCGQTVRECCVWESICPACLRVHESQTGRNKSAVASSDYEILNTIKFKQCCESGPMRNTKNI